MNITLEHFDIEPETLVLGQQTITVYYTFESDTENNKINKSLMVLSPNNSIIFLDDDDNKVGKAIWKDDISIGVNSYKKSISLKVTRELNNGDPIQFQISIDPEGSDQTLNAVTSYKD